MEHLKPVSVKQPAVDSDSQGSLSGRSGVFYLEKMEKLKNKTKQIEKLGLSQGSHLLFLPHGAVCRAVMRWEVTDFLLIYVHHLLIVFVP